MKLSFGKIFHIDYHADMLDANQKDQKLAKEAAGKAAAELIQDGMMIGLGSGSTVAFFIQHLIKRCQQGLRIHATAASDYSRIRAEGGGIPLLDPMTISQIDLAVDGADEIDEQKNMIKGGGGALLREKIIAASSYEMIVIVDETKLVPKIGSHPLPVEVLPFCYPSTFKRLHALGYSGILRLREDEAPYVTDNGNFIIDIHLEEIPEDPTQIDRELKTIPGILETGFFFEMAGRVIIGYQNGHYQIQS